MEPTNNRGSVVWGAAVQRKLFRIEQMHADAQALSADGEQRYNELISELKSLRSLVERPAQNADAQHTQHELDVLYDAISRSKQELSALAGYGHEGACVARASQELDAVIGGTEEATQRILKATESMEDAAKTLAAGMKTDHELGLVQDMQDQITKIYEACNFQDLVGQRVTKATATLRFVEAQVVRLLDIWASIDQGIEISREPRSTGNKLVNGPKLDNDAGHVLQSDIDKMFTAA